MRKLLIVLTALVFVMTACQKEKSHEVPDSNPGGPGGGGNPLEGLLSRMVFSDAGETDSIVSTFAYDNARRLSQLTTSLSGFFEQLRFQRNASGIITQAVIKNPVVVSYGLDSLVIRYDYSVAQSRYQSAVFLFPNSGLTFVDSAAFNYDAGGNMTEKLIYIGLPGGPFLPISKIEYTYTGGNVSSVKSYEYVAPSWNPEYTYNFSYDTKENPLRLGMEAVILDPYATAFGLSAAAYFGPNNATVVDYIDAKDASANYNQASTFTYNTRNHPAGGTALENPGNFMYNWRFYYY